MPLLVTGQCRKDLIERTQPPSEVLQEREGLPTNSVLASLMYMKSWRFLHTSLTLPCSERALG